jgi:Tfp pilus assembly protein PilX
MNQAANESQRAVSSVTGDSQQALREAQARTRAEERELAQAAQDADAEKEQFLKATSEGNLQNKFNQRMQQLQTPVSPEGQVSLLNMLPEQERGYATVFYNNVMNGDYS